MATTNKINWLLILQGWAMLWVVIGHSGPSATFDDYPTYAVFIWNTAYSFHMSLFISISGFLFYFTRLDSDKWTYWATLKEKIVRFGIPFVVFTFIALVLKNVFASSVDRATTLSLSELINAILYPYNGPMREFWFLATIMWYFALFPLWKIAFKNRWMSIITFVGLLVISIWSPDSDFLALRHVSQYAFFFYIGILCSKLYKRDSTCITKTYFAPIALIIGVTLYSIGRAYSIPVVTPLGGIILSLGICLILERMNSNAFSSFRNYTYQIYLLGIFFNVIIIMLRAKLGLPFAPMYVTSLIMGLYMPVLISKVLEWINWKPLLMCVGLKKK